MLRTVLIPGRSSTSRGRIVSLLLPWLLAEDGRAAPEPEDWQLLSPHTTGGDHGFHGALLSSGERREQ